MTRFWPKSLLAQSLAIIVLFIVVVQVLGAAWFWWQWRGFEEGHAWENLAQQGQQLTARLNESSDGERRSSVREWSTRKLYLSLSTYPKARHHPRYDNRLSLFAAIDNVQIMPLRPFGPKPDRTKRPFKGDNYDDDDHEDEDDHDEYENRHDRREWHEWRDDSWKDRRFGPEHVLVSLQLDDGNWLNMRAYLFPFGKRGGLEPVGGFTAMALFILLIFGILLYRVNRPLKALAESAERFGTGQEVTELPEKGPAEIRRAAAALNRMQKRIKRYLEDRAVMFAAMSHDLRTPMTRLRLRAEMVENDQDREAMIRDLESMEMLVSEALAFARDDAAQEPMQDYDLVQLVQEAVMEAPVDSMSLALPSECVIRLRPHAMRRVLDNVLSNAANWGGGAVIVAIETTKNDIRLTIDDNGPGFGDSDPEDLFQPFRRGESSRNRETGGTGLGLAITRSILRAHGGEARLENREEGGARVVLTLPR